METFVCAEDAAHAEHEYVGDELPKRPTDLSSDYDVEAKGGEF